jgi:hypothetical protein
MSSGKCDYGESKIIHVDSADSEYFKPKSKNMLEVVRGEKVLVVRNPCNRSAGYHPTIDCLRLL